MIPHLSPITARVILPFRDEERDAKAIEQFRANVANQETDALEGFVLAFDEKGLNYVASLLTAVELLASFVRQPGHEEIDPAHLQTMNVLARELSRCHDIVEEVIAGLEIKAEFHDEFSPVIMPPLPSWIPAPKPLPAAPEPYDPFAPEVD